VERLDQRYVFISSYYIPVKAFS